MDKRLKWKVGLSVALIVIVGVYLLFRFHAINLGLDLQGGLHLVLEVQADKVVETELVRAKDALNQELKRARINFETISVAPDNALTITASTPEDLAQIKDYVVKEFPNLENKDLVSMGKSVTFGLQEDLVTHWKDNAIRQALITIRNRIDEFGLTEPVIQRQGKNRIIVELAGERDPQRAIDLIGRTAELRFQLVKDFAATEDDLLKRYDGKDADGYEILSGAPGSIRQIRFWCVSVVGKQRRK